MESDFEWISLEEDEEILWSGKPKLQKILGISITEYVVTSDGLYRKTGLFSRSVQKIGFEKVQNISFSQGVLGKAFGYGNIEISTAGGHGAEMTFRSVEDPKKVQEKINRLIRQDSGQEEGRSKKQILEEILSELREINEKL